MAYEDDIFQAQMGTQFETPYESMYLRGQGWNMDASYMTPSYMANMRPQYGGPEGFSTHNLPPFTTMGAMKAGMPSPFQTRSPHYISPQGFQGEAIDQVTTAPGDAAMWGAQNVGAPLASFYTANKFFDTPIKGAGMVPGQSAATKAGGWISGQAKHGANWMAHTMGARSAMEYGKRQSDIAKTMAAAGSRQSLGAYAGGRMGRMFGQAVGGTVGGATGSVAGTAGRFTGLGSISGGIKGGAKWGARGAGAVTGAAGAALGNLLLPFAAMEAGTKAYDEFISDPYIEARRGYQAVRSNTANEYVGPNMYEGMGMGRGQAMELSGDLAQINSGNTAFSDMKGSGYKMFDIAKQTGYMENIDMGDTEEITKSLGNLSKQIQAVMAIQGDPNFQRIIERLSQLKKQGVSGNDLNTTLQALGGAEAITGKSSLEIQNTVGQQGAMLYQQAGISPGGSVANAATTYAGVSNAYKMGLVDSETMAMMGGAKGATQSAMTGAIGLGRSNYNKIAMANRYMFGGDTGSVVGNLGKFGQNVASDPMAMMGRVELGAGSRLGEQLEDNPLAPMNRVMEQLQMIPGTTGRGGRQKWGAVASMMLQNGMSQDQVRAMLVQAQSIQDPESRNRILEASRTKYRDSLIGSREQMGLNYVDDDSITGQIMGGFHGISTGVQQVKGDIAEDMSGMGKAWGDFADYYQGWMTETAHAGAGPSQALPTTAKQWREGGTKKIFGIQADEERLLELGAHRDSTRGIRSVLGVATNLFGDPGRAGNESIGIKKAQQSVEKVNRALQRQNMGREDLDKLLKGKSHGQATMALEKKLGISRQDAMTAASAYQSGDFKTKELEIKSGKEAIADKVRGVLKERAKDRTMSMGNRGRGPGSVEAARRQVDKKTQAIDKLSDDQAMALYEPLMTQDASAFKNALMNEPNMATALTEAEVSGFEDIADLESKIQNAEDGSDKQNRLEQERTRIINELDQSDIEDKMGKMFTGMSESPMARALKYAREEHPDASKEEVSKKASSYLKAFQRAGVDISAEGTTTEEQQQLMKIEKGFLEERRRYQKMLETGNIDFKGFNENISASRMDAAAEKFDMNVDKFGEYVEKANSSGGGLWWTGILSDQ